LIREFAAAPRRPRLAVFLLGSLSIAWLVGVLAGCGLRGARSTDETERVEIFLIAPDRGLGDCRGDRPVAIDVALPRRQPALEGALAVLLATKDRFDIRSGLLHALYPSPLRLRGIDRSGKTARIHLDGYLELGDACDAARVRMQLERTALQFRDLDRVEIDIGGRPLDELLAEAETRRSTPP
jgi:hypothetical protein